MNKEKFLITICSIVLICTIVALLYYTALFDYYKGVKPFIKNMYNIEYIQFIGRQPVVIPTRSGDKFNFGICSYMKTDCNLIPLRCTLVRKKPFKLFILQNEIDKDKIKECEVK